MKLFLEFGIIGIILALIPLYVQYDNMPFRKVLLDKWNSTPKFLRSIILIGLAITPCIMGWVNGCDAHREHELEEAQIKTLQDSVDKSNVALEEVTAKLNVATNQVERQVRKIEEQQRTIGSIAYNTHTTLEGKQRFIQCFRDLTRLTKLNPEGTVFEGLICNDGVAMYWFRQDNEQMTGFHFFTDSELNRVLSGIPADTFLFSEDGTLNIAPYSELAIALNESLHGKTPAVKEDANEQERAIEAIVAEVKTLLRYVYRAEDILVRPFRYSSSPKACPQDAPEGLEFSFSYVVKPSARSPYRRTVKGVTLSNEYLRSLQGIERAKFSGRLIETWRAEKIEPKIKLLDIRKLNRNRLERSRRINSPFAGMEDR